MINVMIKKILLTVALCFGFAFAGSAQKFALIDMEYILKNVPQYEMANEQLNQLSQRWQKEVEAVSKEADSMYKQYLSDKVFLTEEQVKKREEEIVAKEQEATDLKYKYFGPEGELYKKRQTLMKPIQDDIYNAVKKLSEERGYQAIFDRASSANIIYASPRIDVSNEVLSKLGYK
jgi:outer membrane protein